MSLTKILTAKDADPEDQLAQVAEVVAVARKEYGNEDATIPAPDCNTTEGTMSFVHLESASRVQLLRQQVSLIKAGAVEYVHQNPGASMDKQIEERIATNAYFANVGNGTKFAYI